MLWQWQVAAWERDEASLQRDQARQKAEEVRQHLYVANMAQAFRAWQVHDHEGMRSPLLANDQAPRKRIYADSNGLCSTACAGSHLTRSEAWPGIREKFIVSLFSPDGTTLASGGMDGKGLGQK